ncbi:LysR family transcriptional regulator [Saccharomonospora sp. NPDC046836]|uniref:LysR family transcriptional regulator n=1 Tax=Saccharomonospora sp. NPDC046836 TaxID=3156921 RepID=UPI003402444B
MLDVRRMQVLRAVVTSGSISAAARNLGYTPSAISQQLSTLEREVGVVLLERAGRGVRPTAAGSLLSEHAEVLSTQLAKAEAALADLKDGRTGRIAIRYFATAGAALVPPAVAALRRELPGIQVDLKLVEPDDPLPEVESGAADVAIVVFPRATPPAKGVELVHLLDDPYRAVLPKGHPLARKRVLGLADLADEQWVGNEWPPGPCQEIVLQACGAAGFAPNFVVESEDFQTAQGFVAAGLGVSLLPELALNSPHPGVVVRRVRNPTPLRVLYAAVAAHARDNPAVRTLLDALNSR